MGYLKTAPKRYFVEVMAALALMFVIGRLRMLVAHWTSNPALLFAVKLLPLLPILLVAAAVWRLYRSRDEFQRQSMLKTTAAAAALSLLFFMLYPFLRMLGLPPFPPRFPVALLVLAGSYILCGLAIGFLDKRAEAGTARALVQFAPSLLMVLVPAAYWTLSLILPLPPMRFWRGMICFSVAAIGIGFYGIFVRPADQ